MIRDGFYFERPKFQAERFQNRSLLKRYRKIIIVALAIALVLGFIVVDLIRCDAQIKAACSWADQEASHVE